MKTLTNSQVRALACVSNWNIEVGLERLSGVDRRSLYVLEDINLVETIGARKVYWRITHQGRAKVESLITAGKMVRS